jgi:hypothetical protein
MKTYALKFAVADRVTFVVQRLVAESQWFEVTPLPFNFWEIKVKEENHNLLDQIAEELPGIASVVAVYVTVWDSGTTIRTRCEYNPLSRTVSNIKDSDSNPGDAGLEREFVELPDGTEIDTFYNADRDSQYEDGVEV